MVVNQGFRVVRGIVQQAQGNSFIRWNKNSRGLCINNSTVAVVQWLNCVQLFVTPWTAACQSSLSFTVSQSLLKFASTELVMPFNHLILCHCLLLLPSVFLSIRVFSTKSALHIRWPKYWSFTFSVSPSNEYLVFISFRIDWVDLLAVQGTLKSLLQHHNLKAPTQDSCIYWKLRILKILWWNILEI